MSDEQYALSPAPSSPPPTEADYEAIFAAVMETVRGRWFLSEFARRNRHADTQQVLAAIERLQATVRGEQADPAFARIRTDIRDMADAIAATRREIAAIRPDGEHIGIGEATGELDAIVMATARATSDILAAAETIQEIAWTLREQGMDDKACDQLDACATDIYLACSFQDLTGQRTRKVINVLRYLEERITAMVEILGADEEPAPRPRAHGPLDVDMNQADIDAVMPASPAARTAAPPASPVDVAPAGDSAETTAAMAVPSEPASDEQALVATPEATTPEAVPPDATEATADTVAAEDHPDEAHETDMPFAEVPSDLTDTAAAPSADAAEIQPQAEAAGAEIDPAAVARDETALVEPSQDAGLSAETAAADAQQSMIEAVEAAALEAKEAEQADPDSLAPVRGFAPNTAALLADLLAIIRPASETDGYDEIYAGKQEPAERDSEEASVDDMADEEWPEPQPLDLRAIQPITTPSDFVLVALTPEETGTAEPLAPQPMAVVDVVEPSLAPEPSQTPEPSGVAAVETRDDAELLLDAIPDEAGGDAALATIAGPDPVAAEPPLADTAPADATAESLPTDAARLDGAPAQVETLSHDLEIDADDDLVIAGEPLQPSIDAGTIGVGTETATPTVDAGVVDIDDDLLMAPVDVPAPAQTSEPAHTSVPVDMSALVDLLVPKGSATPPEEPAASAPALDTTTPEDSDLLLPAERDTESGLETTQADPADDIVLLADEAPAPAIDAPAAASRSDATDDGAEVLAASEEADEELLASTADGAATVEDAPPAFDPADEVSLSAPDRQEDVASDRREDAAVPAYATAAQLPPADLAAPAMMASAPLNANATAALAVLAMSATANAATPPEAAFQETAGHIDPLAAVKALSVEERIALFS